MSLPRRGTPDFLLLFLTFSLVCFGLAMVFSASSMTSATQFDDPWHYTKRQAIAVVLGTIGMLFTMNVHYNKLKKWVLPLLLVTFALLAVVAAVGQGPNGVKSWLPLGFFNFQPTELAKLVMILYISAIVSKKGDKFRDFKTGLLPVLLVLGFVAFLIMLQPDLGSCAILVLGAAIVIVAGGANLKHLFTLGAVGTVLILIYGTLSFLSDPQHAGYRIQRFTAFMDPWADPTDTGFHLVQSLYAFGHGGFWGAGFGQSIQKLHYLPEAHNDFIFAIIGEEFGFFGTLIFLVAYLLFLWRGIVIALRCPDPFGNLAGMGIVSMIAVQALINLGGVTNTIPLTGVTLPLISYGGSSMLLTLTSMGILLNISREQNLNLALDKDKEKKRR